MDRTLRMFRMLAIVVGVLLVVPLSVFSVCQICTYGDWTTVSTMGGGIRLLPDGSVQIKGCATKRDYQHYPRCSPTDDSLICRTNGTIEISVTTYTFCSDPSTEYQTPVWVVDPAAPTTEEVPDCYSDDGTYCNGG
jgi:hypothetical protein